ncbi:hypothetical protein [Saccharopolyspora tripterygii]
MRRTLSIVAASAAVLALILLIGPSFAVRTEILHRETSQDSGMTYEYSGTQWSSELYLVKQWHLTGSDYELRIGPDAASYYYPVEVGFGSSPPAIREVAWRPDAVEITFTTGDSVHVPADNFRSVR